MSGLASVYRREMLSLWVTPLAWALLVVFLLIQGISFYSIVLHVSNLSELSLDNGPVQAYFGQSIFLLVSLLLVCPALTMRLLAEERRSGTIEALLTAPVTAAGVVLGKYLATLTTYVLLWAPTILYIVILRNTGHVEWSVVGSSYLGVFGIGAGSSRRLRRGSRCPPPTAASTSGIKSSGGNAQSRVGDSSWKVQCGLPGSICNRRPS